MKRRSKGRGQSRQSSSWVLSRACGEVSLWSPTLARPKHDSHDLPRLSSIRTRRARSSSTQLEPKCYCFLRTVRISSSVCPCTRTSLAGPACSPYSRGEATAACSWSAVKATTLNVKVPEAQSAKPNEVGGGVDDADAEWQVAGAEQRARRQSASLVDVSLRWSCKPSSRPPLPPSASPR